VRPADASLRARRGRPAIRQQWSGCESVAASASRFCPASLRSRRGSTVRQSKTSADRDFEIEFLDPGAQAFAFMFG
jgi:hypothetical protein